MVTDLFAYDRMTFESGGRGGGRGMFSEPGHIPGPLERFPGRQDDGRQHAAPADGPDRRQVLLEYQHVREEPRPGPVADRDLLRHRLLRRRERGRPVPRGQGRGQAAGLPGPGPIRIFQPQALSRLHGPREKAASFRAGPERAVLLAAARGLPDHRPELRAGRGFRAGGPGEGARAKSRPGSPASGSSTWPWSSTPRTTSGTSAASRRTRAPIAAGRSFSLRRLPSSLATIPAGWSSGTWNRA